MTNPTASQWVGVNRFIDAYLSHADSQSTYLVYSREASTITSWISAALDIRGCNNSSIYLNSNAFKLEESLQSCILNEESTNQKAYIVVLEVERMSHTDIFRKIIKKYNDIKIVRVMSSIPELFEGACSTNTEVLSQINSYLLNQFKIHNKFTVSSQYGTNLNIELENNNYHWISNRGVFVKDQPIIIPAGEVATYPAKINGTLVADFAINSNNITDIDVRLNENPIEVLIEDNKVKDFYCRNKKICSFIEEVFHTPHGNRVGELGIGTNLGIEQPIKLNSHINERVLGVHLGFGQHNQAGKVSYRCQRHLDLIQQNGILHFEGESLELVKEEVLLKATAFKYSHPAGMRGEDVFSPEDAIENGDCCGVS